MKPLMRTKLSLLLAAVAVACLLGATETANAQISRPGAHHRYSTELEPHLVLQHTDRPPFANTGVGLGFRASFVLVDNGPVTTINNTLALGVGLDWAHFDGNCAPFDCSGNDFWVPIVVQWNFYFSDLISVFPELGVAVEYETWSGDWRNACVGGGPGRWCWYDGNNDLDIELVLWLGIRFHLAREVALTIRLGTPSVLIGASFFL